MADIKVLSSVRRSEREWRTYRSTGPLSADTLIYTGPGIIGAVAIIDDGANAATVSLHDSVDNSGKEIARWVSGADGVPTGWEDMEVEYETGLYLWHRRGVGLLPTGLRR
jgi:hypothetical protein